MSKITKQRPRVHFPSGHPSHDYTSLGTVNLGVLLDELSVGKLILAAVGSLFASFIGHPDDRLLPPNGQCHPPCKCRSFPPLDEWKTVNQEELFVMMQNNRNGQPDEGVCDIWHTVHYNELCVIRQHNGNGSTEQYVCDWQTGP